MPLPRECKGDCPSWAPCSAARGREGSRTSQPAELVAGRRELFLSRAQPEIALGGEPLVGRTLGRLPLCWTPKSPDPWAFSKQTLQALVVNTSQGQSWPGAGVRDV